jgi:hypothetical protein
MFWMLLKDMSRYFYERLPDVYKRIIEQTAPIMIANERKWYRENDN